MTPVPKHIILDILSTIMEIKKENTTSSYISIKNIFKLLSISIPIITIPSGTKLFRIRPHDSKTSSILYTAIQELGHRIDRNGIKGFGRANEPFQSIFYCSNTRKTAFCETSKLIRGKRGKTTEENTIGIWELKRDIKVATLPKDKNYENNKTIKSLNEDFNHFVSKNKNDDLLNLQYFLHKISDEFSQEESSPNFNYLITCAFANYIYETPMQVAGIKDKINIDGITYPSVHWKSEGMNLALRPELIENLDIKLTKAVYNKMELITMDTPPKIIKSIISKEIDYNNFQIIWE